MSTSTAAAGDFSGGRSDHRQQKLIVYREVLRRLRDSNCPQSLQISSFDDNLWAHFNRLPARYALDVNVDKAEDVLLHMKLLQMAKDSLDRIAFEVRNFQPADGSASNWDGLAHDAHMQPLHDGNSATDSSSHAVRPMHEIIFASADKPKLLSQLTALLSEVGLNIQEAHAISTNDGYSLDIFVVDGWPYEEAGQLKDELSVKLQKTEKPTCLMPHSWLPSDKQASTAESRPTDYVQVPADATDVWEIDARLLTFSRKIASGSYGDLYRGTYCNQDVAIKVFKPEQMTEVMLQEFIQEVYIMRKVRHKNVVQFIGSCTKLPSLCIVTEFMSKGSIYDVLHKQKGTFMIPEILKIATDVSKGMNYLHKNNIIHRDLKAANLLMDENEVVKVADFGVARVKAESGVMTAETGTYRWMAPEVIEHKTYDHKADIFSFGVVLWELLTGKLPYDDLTPLQAAVNVVQKGIRPIIPSETPPKLADLIEKCWQQEPTLRPDFSEILNILQIIVKEVADKRDSRSKEKSSGWSALRRAH